MNQLNDQLAISKDLYFIPSIEDIHVGYELEYHNWCSDMIGDPKLNYDRWEATILKNGNVETFMKYGIKEGVRVPYITPKQLEAEGWAFSQYHDLTYYHKKGICVASLLPMSKYNLYPYLEISVATGIFKYDTLFKGQCKCINTFRTICKLINIK